MATITQTAHFWQLARRLDNAFTLAIRQSTLRRVGRMRHTAHILQSALRRVGHMRHTAHILHSALRRVARTPTNNPLLFYVVSSLPRGLRGDTNLVLRSGLYRVGRTRTHVRVHRRPPSQSQAASRLPYTAPKPQTTCCPPLFPPPRAPRQHLHDHHRQRLHDDDDDFKVINKSNKRRGRNASSPARAACRP